jgi:hypothetical protein
MTACTRLCYHPRMRRFDQQRFAKLVSEFIDGCGFDPPFHVVEDAAPRCDWNISVQKYQNPDLRLRFDHTPRQSDLTTFRRVAEQYTP